MCFMFVVSFMDKINISGVGKYILFIRKYGKVKEGIIIVNR